MRSTPTEGGKPLSQSAKPKQLQTIFLTAGGKSFQLQVRARIKLRLMGNTLIGQTNTTPAEEIKFPGGPIKILCANPKQVPIIPDQTLLAIVEAIEESKGTPYPLTIKVRIERKLSPVAAKPTEPTATNTGPSQAQTAHFLYASSSATSRRYDLFLTNSNERLWLPHEFIIDPSELGIQVVQLEENITLVSGEEHHLGFDERFLRLAPIIKQLMLTGPNLPYVARREVSNLTGVGKIHITFHDKRLLRPYCIKVIISSSYFSEEGGVVCRIYPSFRRYGTLGFSIPGISFNSSPIEVIRGIALHGYTVSLPE